MWCFPQCYSISYLQTDTELFFLGFGIITCYGHYITPGKKYQAIKLWMKATYISPICTCFVHFLRNGDFNLNAVFVPIWRFSRICYARNLFHTIRLCSRKNLRDVSYDDAIFGYRLVIRYGIENSYSCGIIYR